MRESNLNELITYLSEGAEIKACNSDGRTLLQFAVERNHLEIV